MSSPSEPIPPPSDSRSCSGPCSHSSCDHTEFQRIFTADALHGVLMVEPDRRRHLLMPEEVLRELVESVEEGAGYDAIMLDLYARAEIKDLDMPSPTEYGDEDVTIYVQDWRSDVR